MTEIEPQNRRLGYARVSTYGQTLDAQLAQLRAAGCRKVYREKASGAQADRRELLKLLKAIRPGEVVTVTRIDRLARSTFDLFGIVRQIVDAGGEFRSLAEPWADTGTSTGRLMIAVLGGLADVERDLIRTRTAEGRSRAMARGQHMGRPPSLTPQQAAEARQRRAEGATPEGTGRKLQRRQIDDFQVALTCQADDSRMLGSSQPGSVHDAMNPPPAGHAAPRPKQDALPRLPYSLPISDLQRAWFTDSREYLPLWWNIAGLPSNMLGFLANFQDTNDRGSLLTD